MLLYNRYILQKVVYGFLATISILICLIWFSRAVAFVSYVTENGVELSKFLYLFVLILPWLLLFIIPISLLAAILIIYSKLITNNEITILKNSNLTKIKISRSTIYFAIFLSLISFVISFYIMPFANKQLRLMKFDFTNNYASLSFNPKTFETLKKLTIYAKERSKDNRIFGILLYDESAPTYSITITAKEGIIQEKNNSALLYMREGTIQKFNYESKKSEILNFDDYVFNLTGKSEKSSIARWKPSERYLNELLYPEANVDEKDIAEFRVELNQRITRPLLSIAFALIGVACMLYGSFNRRGNLSNIVIAIIISATFLILTIFIYNLIEDSAKFIPILYAFFAASFALGYKMLKE